MVANEQEEMWQFVLCVSVCRPTDRPGLRIGWIVSAGCGVGEQKSQNILQKSYLNRVHVVVGRWVGIGNWTGGHKQGADLCLIWVVAADRWTEGWMDGLGGVRRPVVVVVGDLPFYWDTEGKVSFEGYKLIVDGRRRE